MRYVELFVRVEDRWFHDIDRRIAEAHGWEVSVTTGTEGGARFEFTGVETGP